MEAVEKKMVGDTGFEPVTSTGCNVKPKKASRRKQKNRFGHKPNREKRYYGRQIV
jgi:glycyl-tRNA synthetase alpha subunit